MSILAQFSAPNTPWVDLSDGRLTVAASVFLRDLWLRVGGASSDSTADIIANQYQIGAAEAIRSEVYMLRSELEQSQTYINELRATVATLQTALEGAAKAPLIFDPLPIMARLHALEQGVVV